LFCPNRVVAKGIGVVAILVAQRDLVNTLSHLLDPGMLNPVRSALVR
jgi:hypothetical protein